MEITKEDDPSSSSSSSPSSSSFPELLNFSCRIQTLISELLMLSARIPPQLRDTRYDPVLFDLRYFESPAGFEAKIEGNADLETLEDHFHESCSGFLRRFFLLVNGIVVYHQDLFKYLHEIQEGVSLERVIENENGRQLLTESLAYFGCLLLLLEHHMSGYLREKLLVAYIRHDRRSNVPNLEAMCLVCRVHQSPLSGAVRQVVHQSPLSGAVRQVQPSPLSSTMVLVQKPEDLLKRFPFPKRVIGSIMSCLRDCDLYNQTCRYPDPEHRSFALVSQSGCVYVLLFYLPELLHSEHVMREIIATFFKDMWVVPMFMHFTVDLSLSWDAYKGAKAALSTCISPTYIRCLCQFHFTKVKELMSKLCLFLGKDVLSRDYVMCNAEPILSLVRNSSVSLRWLLLQRSSSNKNLRDIVTSAGTSHDIEEEALILFLLKTSQFEFEVKQLCLELWEGKDSRWQGSKSRDSDCMQELSKYYSRSQITEAIYLLGFIGILNEKLAKMVDEDPSILLNMHGLFLKFRPILDVPLLRLSQNQSPDLPFVSAYYTSEYMAHICAILEIIPAMLIRVYDNDIAENLQPFHHPKRIERDNLHDFIKPGQRLHLMKSFNQISIFSQAILNISRTLSGLIDLDVKKWVEGKMRKALSQRFEANLRLFFLSPNIGLEELEMNVQKLTTYILSQFHLMHCLEDLLHLQGICIWEEEFTSYLKHCVQRECDDFLTQRKQDSTVTHVQLQLYNFSKAPTFLGHLLDQMLKLTNPSRSMYIEPMNGWFDAEGHELLALRFFDLLESCVGPVGLASLDSILAFVIMESLKRAASDLKHLLDTRCLEELQMLDTALGPATSLPLLGWTSIRQMAKFVDTLWEPWVESLACIGQLQLLRCLIASKLKSACKVKANLVSSACDGLITSILFQREKLLKGTGTEAGNLAEHLHCLSKQGMLCGFCSPLQTPYISEDPPAFLSRCTSIITILQLPRYVLDTHLGTLTSRLKKLSLDFSPLVLGLGTFLRQFSPIHMSQYVQYMGQYIRIAAETAFGSVQESQRVSAEPTTEVLNCTFWLMYFCKHMDIPMDSEYFESKRAHVFAGGLNENEFKTDMVHVTYVRFSYGTCRVTRSKLKAKKGKK